MTDKKTLILLLAVRVALQFVLGALEDYIGVPRSVTTKTTPLS